MGNSRFYIINEKRSTSDSPVFLCRKRGGSFEYYWGMEKVDAVRYLTMSRIPDINIDLINAVWMNENGAVLSAVF